VYLDCPKFWGRNFHSEDYAESRHDVRLTLKTRASSADRKKIVGIRCILSGTNDMISPSSKERLIGRGIKRYEKDVEEGIPVARGGNVPLTRADDGLKAPEIRRRGKNRKCPSAPCPEGITR
jgi:hypothetical protein